MGCFISHRPHLAAGNLPKVEIGDGARGRMCMEHITHSKTKEVTVELANSGTIH